MKRCFSPLETETVNNSSDRKKAFTEIWTVKEANYKLYGGGSFKAPETQRLTLSNESFVLTAVGEGAKSAELFVI